MAMHVGYETFNDLQVRALNKMGMYHVATGGIRELPVDEQVFAPQGEVYLYQEYVDDEEYEKKMRKLYDETLAAGATDLLPYEELSEFDGYIICKAKYHLAKGERYEKALIIDEVIPLPVENQFTYDDDGNIVKASVFDEN